MFFYPIFPSDTNIKIKVTDTFNRFFKRAKVNPVIEESKISYESHNKITTYIRCIFHDFRGPLNNITLSSDVLLNSDHINKNSDDYQLIKGIKESCIFLGETLDGFLNVSNIDEYDINHLKLTYEPFNVIGLIKKIQYILLSNLIEKNIKLNYDIGELHEWVIGDYKHIQHVLMNILSNAIKFSKNNTCITIKLVSKEQNKIKQILVFSIIDQNPMIRESIKMNLFEKYITSDDKKGNGLGLYICKKIVESHGGTIELSNNSRTAGNIFKVELPLDICPSSKNITGSEKKENFFITAHPEQEHDDKNAPDGTLQVSFAEKINKTPNAQMLTCNYKLGSSTSLTNFGHTKLQFLVVDDSELSRKLMVKIIQQKYNERTVVQHATDGLDALVKMIQFNEMKKNIDVVLLDNVMPNLTGELLSKILRGMNYTGLIFGITGNGLDMDIQKYLECGADYVFTKPFNHDKLHTLFKFIDENGCQSKLGKKIVENTKGVLVWQED
jgi:CheY-like chemotaxis protein/anti-sigma regulatory factor (Ser/Thr protein kinase)